MGYFEKLSGGMTRPTPEPEAQPTPSEPIQEAQPVPAPILEPVPQGDAPADQKPTKPKGGATEDTGDATADDTAARQAHEAAEAQRKAEWDAEQEKKKAAAQAALDKLTSMSDADAIKAAMEHVGAEAERLTRRNMREQVAEHIQAVCQRDPVFARRTMLPDKSMVHCYRYIYRMAKDYMEQEIKDTDPNPASGMYGGDVPDDVVFQWAQDYFDSDDVQEDKKGEEKFVPRPYVSKSGKTSKSKGKTGSKPKAAKPEPAQEGQISFLGEVG